MAVTASLRAWAPEPPGDNRPSLVRWPRWRLLLDDPTPASVLVVGEAEPGVERWLTAIAADVRWVGGPRGLTRPADLVVVGASSAAPSTDRRTLAWLARSCTDGGAVWLPGPRTARRDRALHGAGFARRLWLDDERPRRARGGADLGVVAARRGPGSRPPAWLAGVGRQVGWEPDAPWSLITPGAYPSQKAVALLRPGGRGAGAVVKLAQDPSVDERVRNEASALRGLWEVAPDLVTARAPRVLGEVQVGGTAAVVEEGIWGRPFLRASSLRPGCPLAADAARAATDLATVGATQVPGARLGGQLERVLDGYDALVRPPPAVREALADQIAVITARATVPAVIVHGDLGTWNLLVAGGRVRILDWESAGAAGPPVWDLAHLVRSMAVRRGRRTGLTRARAIDHHLVAGSALTATFASWFASYRARVGLDAELAEALFHTGWMHRAVKEGSRLAEGTVGHYGPLCAHLVERRRAPGLVQLLGT